MFSLAIAKYAFLVQGIITVMAAIIINEDFQRIAGIVRFHRKQAGLSRIQMAKISGVGKTVIYDVEHGKASVRFETLRKICSVLHITIQLNSPLMNQFMEIADEQS